MSRWTKAGLVCAGYLLALIAGGVASHLHDARLSAMPYDTSGGMYAAGVFMAGLGAFLAVAFVPTLLGLWFLRVHPSRWQAISLASLAFAISGLVAVLLALVSPGTPSHPFLIMVSLLGLAQLLGVPLWTLAFATFAFLAPTRPARRLMIAAVGLELVIGVLAAIHWFVPASAL